ncbi:MAG: response regulator transcription factor [Flavobacteriales bacterium]|nr:response regulator transcription factor [Flavobacteriales bacterium]
MYSTTMPMPVITIPEAPTNSSRTVIMFAVAEGQGVTPEQLRTGTPGILLSSNDPQVLLNAIREMGKGNLPGDSSIAQRVMLQVTGPALHPEASLVIDLSPREKEVLNALVEGLSYKMIAARLSISFETVRTHIKRIYEKLRVHNNTEAVAKALRNGLVEYA